MWSKLPWLLIAVVGLVVLSMIGTAVWLLQDKDSTSHNSGTNKSLLNEREQNTCGLPSSNTVAAQETVSISGLGFEPAEVAIKVGQTIRWENIGSSEQRIVIGPHPLHNECIGLDSKELQPGDTFGFTFTKPGKWSLHSENLPSNQSQILVTE